MFPGLPGGGGEGLSGNGVIPSSRLPTPEQLGFFLLSIASFYVQFQLKNDYSGLFFKV